MDGRRREQTPAGGLSRFLVANLSGSPSLASHIDSVVRHGPGSDGSMTDFVGEWIRAVRGMAP